LATGYRETGCSSLDRLSGKAHTMMHAAIMTWDAASRRYSRNGEDTNPDAGGSHPAANAAIRGLSRRAPILLLL